MASEPTTPEKPERFKYRIRFAKAGDLRLVSHHDLMHCCERLFRRAELPIAFSGGFHPTPKMVFALSLPLGVAGANEVLELELTRRYGAADLLVLLKRHAPPGLLFHEAREVPITTKAQARRALYRLELARTPDNLKKRCDDLLAAPSLWVDRAKPAPRRVDIRPFLHELGPDDAGLRIALWVTPNGSAKAEEVLRLLEIDALLEEGGVIERFDLELLDEAAPDAPLPPTIEPGALSAPTRDHQHNKRAAQPALASAVAHPTSLIEGPLSFDS